MRRLLILSALFLVSHHLSAASTANFSVEGTITGSTCQVNDGSVRIPTLSQSQLQTVGAVAGKSPFQITVMGCDPNVSVYFQNDQVNINKAGRLINTEADGANNVELEILNSSGDSINLAADQPAQATSPSVPGDSADSANFDFFVQYYSTGSATPGKVRSLITFLIDTF